jgi:hypothetical protein
MTLDILFWPDLWREEGDIGNALVEANNELDNCKEKTELKIECLSVFGDSILNHFQCLNLNNAEGELICSNTVYIE